MCRKKTVGRYKHLMRPPPYINTSRHYLALLTTTCLWLKHLRKCDTMNIDPTLRIKWTTSCWSGTCIVVTNSTFTSKVLTEFCAVLITKLTSYNMFIYITLSARLLWIRSLLSSHARSSNHYIFSRFLRRRIFSVSRTFSSFSRTNYRFLSFRSTFSRVFLILPFLSVMFSMCVDTHFPLVRRCYRHLPVCLYIPSRSISADSHRILPLVLSHCFFSVLSDSFRRENE